MANKTIKERTALKDRVESRTSRRQMFFQNPEAASAADFVWLGIDGSDAAISKATDEVDQVYGRLISPEALLAEVLLSVALARPDANQKPLPHVRVSQAMDKLLNQKSGRPGKPRDKRDDPIILEAAGRIFAEETGFVSPQSMDATVRHALRTHGEPEPTDDRVRHIERRFNKDKDAYLRLASVWHDARQDVGTRIANAIAAIEALGVPVCRPQGRYFPD